MRTRYIKIDSSYPEEHLLRKAARLLQQGGLAAFPTETVYGLGAPVFNLDAVGRLFQVKGRPPDNPMIVHVAEPQEVNKISAGLSRLALNLMTAFWPGPLTLVLPSRPEIPRTVTAGLQTVAVRMPAHPVALGLIRLVREPLAAPSANLSGRPSPTTARHVLRDLGGKIEAVVDGGPAAVGVESTVLDLTVSPPRVLRPGGVPLEDLRRLLGEVAVGSTSAPEEPVRSPGLKYKHYAPQAPLLLFQGEPPALAREMIRRFQEAGKKGRKVVFLVSTETARRLQEQGLGGQVEILGSRRDLQQVAARLYTGLINCDRRRARLILGEVFPEKGLGEAVMNRLQRASGRPVIKINGV